MKKFETKEGYPNVKLGTKGSSKTKGRLRSTFNKKEKDYILGLYFSGITVGNIRKHLEEENLPVPAAITLYGYTGKHKSSLIVEKKLLKK